VAERRTWAGRAVLLLVVVLAVGATGPLHPEAAGRQDVAPSPVVEAYAQDRSLTVYRPVSGVRHGRARPPVVVLIHGCCGDSSDLRLLAEAVAAAGAVVINADWAGIDADARFPGAYEDVACAVRFANARASQLGGDPSRVVLAGWSDGALPVTVVAAAGQRFDNARCRYPQAAPWPAAAVGMAGFYGWSLPVPDRYVTPRAVRFLGGAPEDAREAWAEATPYSWLPQPHVVSTTLLVSERDPLKDDAHRFARWLTRAGRPVRLVVLPYGGDGTLLSPRTGEGRRVVSELLRAADDRGAGHAGGSVLSATR
jgi:acetyl esterase/lipase